MSLSEIALATGGVALGAAVGSLSVYLYSRRTKSEDNSAVPQAAETHANFGGIEDKIIQRLIPKPQLEKTKREMRTLLLEKDLVSAALTRLYEAEAAHEITREEREILGLKYREELKALNEKIEKIDAFIEVGDLETLREQLLNLVTQKMDAIEKRIESTRLNAGPLLTEITKPAPPKTAPVSPKKEEKPRIPDISDLVQAESNNGSHFTESFNETREKTPEAVVDEVRSHNGRVSQGKKTNDAEVDQLQKELLEALDRLEKLDIES